MVLCITSMIGCSTKREKTTVHVDESDHELNQENIEDQETITADIVALDYKKQAIRVLTPMDDSADISQIKDINTANYRLTIYNIQSDDENLSIGIWLKDIFYPVGKVAGKAYEDEIMVQEVSVNHKDFIKIEGIFGATYPIMYYLAIEDEPKVYIDNDLPVTIMDLDEDGTLEWISSYYGQVSIYKLINDDWYHTNVSDAVGKDMIFMRETQTFEVQERNGATYQFLSDQLKVVKPSNAVE